jgi:signal transduction histidine kinase
MIVHVPESELRRDVSPGGEGQTKRSALSSLTAFPSIDPGAAFDVFPNPALVVDRDWRIVLCNEALGALLGRGPDEVVGCPLWTILSPLDLSPGDQGDGHARPYTLFTPSGSRGVRVGTRRLAGDSTAGALLVLVEPQVGETPANGDSSLLLDVAHELRSPLHAMTVALSALDDRSAALEGDDKRLLQAARRSTVHMQTLVDNLLDAVRIGARRFSISLRETHLRDVFDEALLLIEPLLLPQGQTVVVDCPDQMPTVLADAQRLRQVLVNLLHNAIKYGPSAEVITLRASRRATTVMIEVIDRGPGIPLEEQPYLFDLFFRGGTAERCGQGSGLGLSIAKAIVEAHCGRIGVCSSRDKGTTFWFTVGTAVAHPHR